MEEETFASIDSLIQKYSDRVVVPFTALKSGMPDTEATVKICENNLKSFCRKVRAQTRIDLDFSIIIEDQGFYSVSFLVDQHDFKNLFGGDYTRFVTAIINLLIFHHGTE